MATKITVEMVDDIDGSTADVTTIEFTFEGVTYEVDLSDKNANKLRKALDPYVSNGRRVGGRKRRAGAPTATAGGDSSKIREWASSNGYQVSSRGRVSAEIQRAYAAAV